MKPTMKFRWYSTRNHVTREDVDAERSFVFVARGKQGAAGRCNDAGSSAVA